MISIRFHLSVFRIEWLEVLIPTWISLTTTNFYIFFYYENAYEIFLFLKLPILLTNSWITRTKLQKYLIHQFFFFKFNLNLRNTKKKVDYHIICYHFLSIICFFNAMLIRHYRYFYFPKYTWWFSIFFDCTPSSYCCNIKNV